MNGHCVCVHACGFVFYLPTWDYSITQVCSIGVMIEIHTDSMFHCPSTPLGLIWLFNAGPQKMCMFVFVCVHVHLWSQQQNTNTQVFRLKINIYSKTSKSIAQEESQQWRSFPLQPTQDVLAQRGVGLVVFIHNRRHAALAESARICCERWVRFRRSTFGTPSDSGTLGAGIEDKKWPPSRCAIDTNSHRNQHVGSDSQHWRLHQRG